MACFKKHEEFDLEMFIENMALRISHILPKEPSPQGDYMTVREVAKRTRLSPRYIRKQIHIGALPAANLGTSFRSIFRISAADLDYFMDERKCREFGNPSLIFERLKGIHRGSDRHA